MDLNLTWKQDIGTDIFIYDKEMAQFDILTAKRAGKHPVYHSGKYTQKIVFIGIYRFCLVGFEKLKFSEVIKVD